VSKIEDLAANFGEHIGAPWQRTVAGAQRVVLLVYDKELERTLRARLELFEQATNDAGHPWKLVDCTRWFAEWIAEDEYREGYFEEPDLLGMKLEGEFKPYVAQRLTTILESADEDTVVGVLGAASLYGFLRISELVRDVEQSIRGRLVLFFPGTKNENNYRLLDARDGWNYLAAGITHHKRGDA
jgi:hypothetical protein